MSKNDKLDIDKMYLSVVDDKLGYAVIPDSYVNWDLFEDDDCDERTIYQIEGPRETIAHDIHNKALAEVICKVPQMMWELRRCYDFIESLGLNEDIEHKMVIDLRECSWECLHQLCVQAGVEDGTKEEMIARLLE